MIDRNSFPRQPPGRVPRRESEVFSGMMRLEITEDRKVL